MGYIIGIDLGGMSAKAAIFDGEGRILAKSNIATNSADGFDGTAKKLDGVARAVAREAKIEFSEVEAIGIASPGVVNSKTGVVLKWGNYGWLNAPLGETVEKLTGKKVYVANDANAAAVRYVSRSCCVLETGRALLRWGLLALLLGAWMNGLPFFSRRVKMPEINRER